VGCFNLHCQPSVIFGALGLGSRFPSIKSGPRHLHRPTKNSNRK
jgi:hypothetical protein